MHPSHSNERLVCPDCDALLEMPDLSEGEKAICPRCVSPLLTNSRNSLHRTAALAMASARSLPRLELLSLHDAARPVFAKARCRSGKAPRAWRRRAIRIWPARFRFSFWRRRRCSSAVCFTCSCLCFGAAVARRESRFAAGCLATRRWNMIEVFLLGALVSLLKLGQARHPHSRDFFLVFRWPDYLPDGRARFDSSARTLGPPGNAGRVKTFAPDSAAARGLALCHVCGLATPVSQGRCPRCGQRLHLRVRKACSAPGRSRSPRCFSIFRRISCRSCGWNRSPATISQHDHGRRHPVLAARRLSGRDHYFCGQRHDPDPEDHCHRLPSAWLREPVAGRARMTRIYRVTELIGRWSMVDVFVVAILVAVVQLGSAISIHPGAARTFVCRGGRS